MHIVRRSAALALLLGLLAAAWAGVGSPSLAAPVPAAKEGKTYQVPYRMTAPRHILVRLKINGKGPFNFILDTGAPALIVSTEAAKKAGLKADDNGWGTIDQLDIEGGVRLPKTTARIETPFQLKGMNGIGLAGYELHGLLGYTVLARFRMEIDFTKTKMAWTLIDDEPKLAGGRRKGGGGQGELEVFGGLMKAVGTMLGRKPAPEVVLRGFFGMTLEDGDEGPVVKAVLEKGPAAEAGLKADDAVMKVEGRTVTNVGDVMRLLRNGNKVAAGNSVKLTVKRGRQETKQITLKIGEGL